MNEYIELKALREALDNADADIVEEYEDGYCDFGFGRQNILEVINSVPIDDVAPVRHGRWKISSDYGLSECSTCGWNIEEYVADYAYCPNCGAKMDLEDV